MRLKTNNRKLRAEAEAMKSLLITGSALMQNLTAEAKAEGKRPTFTMSAYAGGPIRVGYSRPVVIDVAGIRARARIPILLDHNHSEIVGQATPQIANGEINIVDGVVTGEDAPATKVVSHARNGFVWAASVGVFIDRFEAIDANTTVSVNGKEHQGPLYVARAGRLGEVSFVSIGADDSASAKVAASRATGEYTMTFEQWLEANDWDTTNLSAAKKATLKAAFEAEIAASEGADPDANKPKPINAAKTEDKTVTANGGDESVADIRAAAASESKRIAEIHKLASKHPDLQAKAIEENWTAEKTKYEVALANMPKAPAAIIADNAPANARVLEASIRMGSGEAMARIEKDYKEDVLEAAHKHRRIGLKALIQSALAAEGKQCPTLHASIDEWVQAGFSTATLPSILSNSANKMLQASFMNVPMASRLVARRLSANDFKTHTGMRLTGDPTFAKVGPGGELTHMSLADTNYTYGVDTFGRMIGLTRQQWTNDDLGAFSDIPMKLGRGAALKIESDFWAMVEANAGTFFGTGNLNYISGATTALGIEGLRLGIEKMAKLKDSDSLPINVQPKFLVVPPELEGMANEIFRATGLIATGVPTSAKNRDPATNIYSGRFTPVMSPYLTAAGVWYLLADPNDVACFGIAYLNGVDTPVVEQVPQSPEVLGFQWRGYIDFGVCQIDKQGGIKSAGA